ncbi:MAG: nitroreductase [Candidatus Lindowbacteria bacterium]|nr:nitroreductase [Candidatus Lindowbacteria bacterium]
MTADMFNQEIFRVIAERHCKRAFISKSVDREILESVLTNASNAPSSKNTQPWGVVVVSGKMRDELSHEICDLFDKGIYEEPEYKYSPDPLPSFMKDRARKCGFDLFDLKNIDKHDKPARKVHERENYIFFGAPVVMIFHLPANAEKGTFLDMGFFMQNVMLGLVGAGLVSCPQASQTRYSATIRKRIDLPQDRIIVAGLALGYVDNSKKVNEYIPKRLELNEYVEWRE